MGTETVLERKLAIEGDAKRTLAVEKLILSLSLTMCVPGVDLRDVTDTHEQIDDLIKCFSELKLGEEKQGKKKAKKETSAASERSKALSVLFDLLIA